MSVRIENLSKHFGTQKAVDQISFKATKGKILGFLGPNGAGKSTTMKMATGYLLPTEGDVWVENVSVTKEPLKIKRLIGYLPEHNPMYQDMYVREFLSFIGQAYGLNKSHRTSRVNELIEICGLSIEQHKNIHMLSKGYRQRVGLAKALMGDPEVLILDEPTSGLDPNQLLEIRKVIKDIAQEKTVILSTHIMQEVEALCEEVVIINRGKIVANESLSELRKKSKTEQVRVSFDAPIDTQILERLEGVTIEIVSDEEFLFSSENKNLRNEILALVSSQQLPLSGIQNAGGSLEEIFHSLTNKEVKA
jgi:ABC-2 type transport system ATP-binding protein